MRFFSLNFETYFQIKLRFRWAINIHKKTASQLHCKEFGKGHVGFIFCRESLISYLDNLIACSDNIISFSDD